MAGAGGATLTVGAVALRGGVAVASDVVDDPA